MSASDHVAFVLQVMLAVGPLSVYFVSLGLVNSQPHSCIAEARGDFSVLTLAFVPMVAVPLGTLVNSGYLWLAAGVAVAGVVSFVALLPRRHSGWVVYNSSERQCRALVGRACRVLGWSRTQMPGGSERIEAMVDGTAVSWTVRYQPMPWLRNVSLDLSFREDDADSRRVLGEALRREVRGESLLPSAAGLTFVLIGTGLLGVPMGCLIHHMDAVVEVIRELITFG